MNDQLEASMAILYQRNAPRIVAAKYFGEHTHNLMGGWEMVADDGTVWFLANEKSEHQRLSGPISFRKPRPRINP